MTIFAAMIAGCGCQPTDQEPELYEYRPLDEDGDGFQSCEDYFDDDFYAPEELYNLCQGELDTKEDCDDTEASIYPEAPELCDGMDNDCDLEIDEEEDLSFEWYYADTDGDGFGDVDAAPIELCAPEAGLVNNADDCDDDNPNINPEALEYCDGIDSDCNEIDDDDYAEDVLSWYIDGDGDNYGAAETEYYACYPIDTSDVDNGDDCNDNNPDIYPGATEQCNGLDDDCSGSPDADEVDNDTDGFMICDLDCDDTSSTVYPGANELCDGIDNDCDLEIDEDVVYQNWYLDGDGDGYGDALDLTPVNSCNIETGRVTNNDDCDDADPNINPDETETCNGLDDDCNGIPDDGLTFTRYYIDADADGYGDASDIGEEFCADPGTGYTLTNTDCDDSDPTIWSEEILYGDVDGDGYTNGTSIFQCIGSTAPTGYSLTESIYDDCDDSNAALYQDLTGYAEADGDGYSLTTAEAVCSGAALPSGYLSSPTTEDCDDTDATIYPGATDYCDGVDKDCDGTVDEDDSAGAPTWYANIDGDAYGDLYNTTTACYSAPIGYLADNTDCDDTDATIYPGATDYCDGVDKDCDGTVDENDSAGASTWYEDADGDNYGNTNSTATACYTAPAGYLADNTDCDDDDPDENPGLTEDTDRIGDEDCSGQGEGSLANATATYSGLNVGDYLGTDIANAGDMDGDGLNDVIIGAPSSDGNYPYINEGELTVLYGHSSSFWDSAEVIVTGETTETHSGFSVIAGYDFDGDGVNDVVYSAPYDSSGYTYNGAVYLISGSITGDYQVDASNYANKWVGEADYDYFGQTLAAGDVNGDGHPDLLMGSATTDGSAIDSGEAYVMLGPITPDSTPVIVSSVADITIPGTNIADYLAISAAIADFDNDGYDDIAVGADGAGTGGEVYVWKGTDPMPATLDPLTADATFTAAGVGFEAGRSLFAKNGTDLTGDGGVDLVVGERYNSYDCAGFDAGAIYVIQDPLTSAPLSFSLGARICGDGDVLGSAHEGYDIADLNGDGVYDLLLGNPGNNEVLLYFGALNGVYDVYDANQTLSGDFAWGSAGTAVALVDINGDGIPEIIATDPESDMSFHGKAFVIDGSYVDH